eukprot:GEMP01009943.1.p1 GENE.GEMP01009943.1~~GEMP01009943.1.p1  ORF type:complete len:928 (-),score=144.75 GEMP01009943.1:481-3264(-)
MALSATQDDFLLHKFSDVRQIRNVCIIAHVDHGKTTLSDTLLSSNGIISDRSAGELRYLDSRGDERERQITMKSSAIALRWTNPINKDDMLINLIDSPGHVDFASEVNMATRLADGALVVVDVVEGVSSQTRAVLRQAWKDDLKTILVLNKVDRLMSERALSPDEAYEHINRILEAVNAATQQLVAENILGENGADTGGDGGHEVVFDDEAAEKWTYHPRHGNVIFCSAIHGWGFSVPSFVDICASKLKCNRDALLKTFWGDYSYIPKTQKILKRTPGSSMRPIFSQFVLDVIWKLYAATGDTLDKPYLTKMQTQCGFTTPVDELRPNCTKHVLSAWLPLSREILDRIIAIVPDPHDAAISRLPHFVHNLLENDMPLASALRSSARDGPIGAFVTKFLLADATRNVLVSDSWDPDVPLPGDFVGLTRVFSGTLRPGTVVRYAETDELVRIKYVFMMMGMDLIRVSAVPAGMICGVLFEEQSVAQYMTLVHAESEWVPLFQSPYPTGDATSILTVALETPVEYLEKLIDALQMLRRADPAIEIRILDTGEYCIGCCGSEHLKRCLHDLETVYCPRIPFTVSEPLVACRETLAPVPPGTRGMLVPPWVKKTDTNPNVTCEPSGAITLVRKGLTISVRAFPYECEWIEDLEDDPRNWNLDELRERDSKLVAVSNARGARTVLFNHDENFPWKLHHSYHPNRRRSVDDDDTAFSKGHLCSALLTGFGLASQAGPLCEEPMRNVAFALEKVELGEVETSGQSGQAMYTMKEALRQAFLRYTGTVRLTEPILSLDIQAEQEVVGKVYGVLHKRRTKILSEEMREGTSTFIISAHIPLSESFGLVDELRTKASGLAHYSAWFSHWQMLDEDPFYELSLNDEDYEDHGEAGSLERYPHNVSRKLITQIRKRKGLPVDEKIISSDSTKQRTMTRNK